MISEKMLVLITALEDAAWQEGRHQGENFGMSRARDNITRAVEDLEKENTKLKRAQTRFKN